MNMRLCSLHMSGVSACFVEGEVCVVLECFEVVMRVGLMVGV